MSKLITIDGKQYEQHPFNGLLEGWIALKPLPKQPEAEKLEYAVKICQYDNPEICELQAEYQWTQEQAQLAADAVRELLKWIQKETNTSAWSKVAHLADKARDAITKGET